MKKTVFTSAIAAGFLALTMGSPAKAAEVVTTTASQATITMLNAHDMMIQAGSETANVELHFAGADLIQFGVAGELFVTNAKGNRMRYRPDVYQMIHGKMHPVAISYKMDGKDRVKVHFGKFDKSAPVILRRGAATL